MSPAVKRKTKLRYRLVHAARTLFSKDGYEKTTVAAIIDMIGVSKGAFYYHFPSKAAILDAVVDFITEDIGGIMPIRLQHAGPSPVAQINEFLNTLRVWQLQAAADMSQGTHSFFRPENALMREKLKFITADRVAPVLATVIQQGIYSGLCADGEPEEIARFALYLVEDSTEMHLRALSTATDMKALLERYCDIENTFRTIFERSFGLPQGSLERVVPDMLPKIEELFRETMNT